MTRGFAAFVLGGFKSDPSNPASPLNLHVLHHHHPITALFHVLLNERGSQGTATNGCCTVIVTEVLSSSSAEFHLALAMQIPTSTEYGKTQV